MHINRLIIDNSQKIDDFLRSHFLYFTLIFKFRLAIFITAETSDLLIRGCSVSGVLATAADPGSWL